MAIPTGNTKWCLTQTPNGPLGANNREPYDSRLETTGFDHGEEVKQSDLNEWMYNVGEKIEYVMGEVADGGGDTGSDILIEIDNSMTWTAIQEKIDAEVPRIIPWRIQVTIEFADGAYLVTSGKHFRIPSYSGGGLLIVKAKNTVDPFTDIKKVIIQGDGGQMFNEFQPYSTYGGAGGQAGQRYLVAAANVPYVLLGDIKFILTDGYAITVSRSATIASMDSTVSVNHNWVINERDIDGRSLCVAAFNSGSATIVRNRLDAPLSSASGLTACMESGNGAFLHSFYNRGAAMYAYYAYIAEGAAQLDTISYTVAEKAEYLGQFLTNN